MAFALSHSPVFPMCPLVSWTSPNMFLYSLHYALGSDLGSSHYPYVFPHSSMFSYVFALLRIVVLIHMYRALGRERIDSPLYPHTARRSPELPLQVHTLPSDLSTLRRPQARLQLAFSTRCPHHVAQPIVGGLGVVLTCLLLHSTRAATTGSLPAT